MKRKLVLENGMEFMGTGFGAEVDTIGEVVFTTGMTGYQESLSDPSFYKQILVFTYPLIGNYGVNVHDFESLQLSVSGVVVHEFAARPSHFQSAGSLDDYLSEAGIPGLAGIDTRMLTKVLREHGSLRGKFCDAEVSTEAVAAELQSLTFTHHMPEISVQDAYVIPGAGWRVVVLDFGAKKSIMQELSSRGCHVTVVPYDTSAEAIMRLQPDGVLLSNGPGDPAELTGVIEEVAKLVGAIPVFGICLGHQLLALAAGAKTYKLPFGHRGANHPVVDLASGRVYITSQNHGYAVDEASLADTELQLTHRALNDGSVEGLMWAGRSAFSVQYHPEANPGPDDSRYLFEQFMLMMAERKERV